MTTDHTATVQDAADRPSAPPAVPPPFRPAPPARGPGRWLRMVAGVREDVLDWVPEERPRYSRLGAIIVNTGLLAGLSLLVGLGKVVPVFWLYLLPVALVWAFIILTFDGWLIASTHGAPKAAKVRVFLPRLFISILMGAVIAEPLLLWVFQPAIHKEVLDQRQNELSAYASQWALCNPQTGEVIHSVDCRNFQLSTLISAQPKQDELTRITAQRTALKTQIDQIATKLAAMNATARAECNGKTGTGLSGRVGEGPNCRRDRKEADQFRSDSQLDAHQAALTAMDKRIVTLTADLQQDNQKYTQSVGSAIADKVAKKEASQGTIGILDDDAALERLAGRSGVVLAAEWLVRLLLIAIDCLPVLTKMMSVTTGYDRRVDAQRDLGEALHAKFVALKDRQSTNDSLPDFERYDKDDREVRAQRQAAQRAEIDALAELLYTSGVKDSGHADSQAYVPRRRFPDFDEEMPTNGSRFDRAEATRRTDGN